MADPTPGPWVAYEAVRRGYTVHGSGDSETIIGWLDEEGRYGAVALEANARLIAAAPDLLEVVQKYLAWVKAEENHEGTTFWERVEMYREVDTLAEAAIAKVQGKANETE